jgi:putative ABC transport system ATP-binding protein
MISMRKIRKVYSTGKVPVEALRGVDLEIDRNEFVAVMGPSGSGKSTLMHIVGCLDKPTSGSYRLEDQEVQGLESNELAEIRNKKIGFVFQNFNLLSYATARENVELPLIFAGMTAAKRKEKADRLLGLVGLGDRVDHKPGELSGGEMQRVAIARSLANSPSILLADEPTGNLDSKVGQEIISLFLDLWRKGHTIVLITHDHSVAEKSGRILKLQDGRIVDSVTL